MSRLREQILVKMTRSCASADRAFGWRLLLLIAVSITCLLALASLRSESGARWFAYDDSAVTLMRGDLTIAVRGPESGDPEAEVGTPLGALSFDAKSSYLLTADLSAGGRVVFIGQTDEGPSLWWRCPPGRVRGTCQKVVQSADLPEELRLVAYGRGTSDRSLYGLTVRRVSAAHGWLPPVVLSVLGIAMVAFLLRDGRRLLAGLSDPRPIDDVAFALLLFATCFLVFFKAPVTQVLDSRYLTAVSHSLIRGDGIVLPEEFKEGELRVSRRRTNRGYQIQWVEGRLMHHYSPFPAILDAPVVWAYELVGVTPALPGGLWDRPLEIRIMRFSAGMAAALLCVVFYRTARGFLRPLPSLGLVLAFAFGTQVLSTLSRPYWSHTWGAVFAAVAIHLVVLPLRRRGVLSAVLAASSASLAFFCRPQTLFTALGLVAGLALMRSWRRLVCVAATGAFWAIGGVVASLLIYGAVLPDYFFASQQAQGIIDVGRAGSYRYVTASLGALVSPGRGLFVYCPLFLLILYQVVRRWRSLASRTWAGVAIAVILGHLWLLIHTGVWPGGKSYGPRQFSDVLPWFFLLGVLAIAALQREWPRFGSVNRGMQVATATLLLSFSVFVHMRGAYARATWEWKPYARPPAWVVEGREPPMPQHPFWNWRYPQFMAGLLPLDAPGEAATEVED